MGVLFSSRCCFRLSLYEESGWASLADDIMLMVVSHAGRVGVQASAAMLGLRHDLRLRVALFGVLGPSCPGVAIVGLLADVVMSAEIGACTGLRCFGHGSHDKENIRYVLRSNHRLLHDVLRLVSALIDSLLCNGSNDRRYVGRNVKQTRSHVTDQWRLDDLSQRTGEAASSS